jgi:hypothetical protein
MLKSKETAVSGPSGGAGGSAGGSAFGAGPSFDPFQAATYGGGGAAFNQFANMN